MTEQAKHTPFWRAVRSAYKYGVSDAGAGAIRDLGSLDDLADEIAALYPVENAAPELLAACQQVAEWADLLEQDYPDMAGLVDGARKARVAIAKAREGGTA